MIVVKKQNSAQKFKTMLKDNGFNFIRFFLKLSSS